MALLQLPNELLLLVATTLPTRDQASLILSNHRLNSLLSPALTALARTDYRALHHAVHRGYHDVIQRYLALGVPVSIADGESITALHEAVGTGDDVAVKMLLGHGAALEVETTHTSYRETPLLRALAGREEEVVRVLLEAGADPNARGGRMAPMDMVFASRAYMRMVGEREAGWEKRVAALLVRYGAEKRRVTWDARWC